MKVGSIFIWFARSSALSKVPGLQEKFQLFLASCLFLPLFQGFTKAASTARVSCSKCQFVFSFLNQVERVAIVENVGNILKIKTAGLSGKLGIECEGIKTSRVSRSELIER